MSKTTIWELVLVFSISFMLSSVLDVVLKYPDNEVVRSLTHFAILLSGWFLFIQDLAAKIANDTPEE